MGELVPVRGSVVPSGGPVVPRGGGSGPSVPPDGGLGLGGGPPRHWGRRSGWRTFREVLVLVLLGLLTALLLVLVVVWDSSAVPRLGAGALVSGVVALLVGAVGFVVWRVRVHRSVFRGGSVARPAVDDVRAVELGAGSPVRALEAGPGVERAVSGRVRDGVRR